MIQVIAIIGTAGRNDDAEKLNLQVYDAMYIAAMAIADQIEPDIQKRTFTSGGAAYADQITVRGFLEGKCKTLVLHLPAPFDMETCRFVGSRDAEISNYYHDRMFKKTGVNSLQQIKEAIEKGAIVCIGKGFFDRNNKVALARHIIALTFGPGTIPKDGGTKHTWDAAKTTSKFHIAIGKLSLSGS